MVAAGAGDECRLPFPGAKFPELLCIARVPKAVVQNQTWVASPCPAQLALDAIQ